MHETKICLLHKDHIILGVMSCPSSWIWRTVREKQIEKDPPDPPDPPGAAPVMADLWRIPTRPPKGATKRAWKRSLHTGLFVGDPSVLD